MPSQLTFAVNCSSPLAGPALDSLPQLLARNPFGQYSEWIDDSERAGGDAQTYSEAALRKILHAKSQWNITVVGQIEGGSLSANLMQRARGATISVSVDNERLKTEYELFLNYARSWLQTLPNVSSGRIFDPNDDVANVHRRHNIGTPPACFTTHLRWVHFLAPSYYTLFLTTEDLLAAPAYSVEQVHGGIVALRNYADPFAGSDPANLRRLTALTEYLQARDLFLRNR